MQEVIEEAPKDSVGGHEDFRATLFPE